MPVISGVNIPRLRLGIAALRSGLYVQATGCLHRVTADGTAKPGWCCLGVLTDIAIKIGGVQLERIIRDSREFFSGENVFLHPAVVDFYGLPGSNPILCFPGKLSNSASSVNDVGWDMNCTTVSFDEIADAFEYTYITGERA